MIDRAMLATIPAAQRAKVIYAEAKSELSTRLWRAALGDAGPQDRDSPAAFTASRSDVQSLLKLVASDAPSRAAPSCDCSLPSADAAPAVQATPTASAPAPPARTSGDGLGANEGFRAALCAAARRTGVPATALASLIDAEAAKLGNGRWNPFSRNPRSSAAGLGQFLSGTWESLAETPGSQLNTVAAQNGWLDSRGKVRDDARGALLALRYDPEAAINGVADYARHNLDRLAAQGVDTRGDTDRVARAAYLSHHLGASDAMKFLTKGIVPDRARILLHAQIGPVEAERRIAEAGSATRAHQQWLLGYIDRRIQPTRFAI